MKRFFTCLFIFSGMLANAQHKIAIRGLVKDSVSQQPLADATLILFRGTEMISKQRSQDEGFLFSGITSGRYRLVTSFAGFVADTFSFSIAKKDTADIVLNIQLQPFVNPMMEVVIQAKIPPIIIKSDTIAFNAGAYPSPPNSTVEDLLKKLPGIQVDADGNVTMQGQKVDKIYIDGKEFFLNDLKAATQNLPADIVSQIEAFDSQSNHARLLGIKEQSTTKTLNIKLKKNKKHGYFGTMRATGGTDKNYSAGGNITRLADSSWLFGVGHLINTNNSSGTVKQSGADAQINYRDALSKQLTITVNAAINKNHNEQSTSLTRQTALSDSSQIQNSTTNSISGATNTNANLFLEYKPDTLTTLNLRSGWSGQNNNNRSYDTVALQVQKPALSYFNSTGVTNNQESNRGNNITNAIDFNKRFHKKGEGFLLSLSQTHSATNQPATLYSLIDIFDSAGSRTGQTLQNQQSTQPVHNDGYGVNASFTQPVGAHHVLDFNYSYNYSSGHSDKRSFDYDSATGKYDHLDSLTTNLFINQNNSQRFGAGYNTIEGKYRFQLGLAAQITSLNSEDLVHATKIKQQTLNWYPRATLLWEIAKGKNIDINYTGTTTAPTTDQLQPVPDLTNPYLIKVGNPGLQQQITHSASASYGSFNPTSFHNLQISLNGDYTEHKITSSGTVLAGGVQQLEYVNVEGVYHLSSYASYGFPINGQKHGNGSVSAHASTGHDISLVNGQENVSTNTGIGGSINLNYHLTDLLFVDFRGSADLNDVHYSLAGTEATETLDENINLNFSYKTISAITVTSNYNLQVTGSQATLPAHSISLWNASVYRNFFKGQHWQLKLSGSDLLNSGKGVTQSIGVNYVQTQTTSTVGRIFFCSVIYNFRKFGGSI